MAASFAVHKMVTSGGFLRFESVTSRSLAGTLCLMFFLPSTTNTPRGHEEGELISGKVVLRLAQGVCLVVVGNLLQVSEDLAVITRS